MKYPEIDQIAEELLAVVPQLHRMMTSDARRDGNDHASVPQIRLLAELRHGPQTMSALARQQHVSPQAVCDLIHDMLERGWLTRVPNEHDRRQQLLNVTELGEIALAEAQDQALRQLTPRLRQLTDTELYVLAAALPTLQRVLNQGDHNGHAEGERPGRRAPDGP
jgi:DNA-binding MarR family transcriptional regulator